MDPLAAAAAAAANTALDDVKKILRKSGLSNEAVEGFTDSQGITSISSLGDFSPDDVQEMVKMHNDALPRDDKQRIKGFALVQRLEALITQVRYHQFTGVQFDTTDWMYVSQMNTAISDMKALKKARDGETEPTALPELKDPGKLDTEFEKIESGFKTTLEKIESGYQMDIGIEYLLLKAGESAPAGSSSSVQRRYAAASKTGLATDEDSKKFWRLLKEWGADLPAWPTLKRFEKQQDGRAAFHAMRDLYEGEDYKQKRLAREKRLLQESGEGSLQYHGEHKGLRFTDYASKLLIPMDYIHDERGGWPDEARIERLIAGIGTEPRQHSSIQVGIERLVDEKGNWTYHRAVSYLAGKVASAYADTLAQAGARQSRINEAGTSQNGGDTYGGDHGGRGSFRGGRGGRGFFRGGRGGRGGRGNYSDPALDGSKEVKLIHGVDTSDTAITEGMVDWHSPVVRAYCKKRRHFLRTGKTNLGSDNGKERSANISQVQMDIMIKEAVADALKGSRGDEGKGDDSGNTKPPGEKGGHMGSGMGKGAHKGGKK